MPKDRLTKAAFLEWLRSKMPVCKDTVEFLKNCRTLRKVWEEPNSLKMVVPMLEKFDKRYCDLNRKYMACAMPRPDTSDFIRKHFTFEEVEAAILEDIAKQKK